MEYVIQKTCKEFSMCSDILSTEMTMKQLSLLIRCISYVIKHKYWSETSKRNTLKKQMLTKKLWIYGLCYEITQIQFLFLFRLYSSNELFKQMVIDGIRSSFVFSPVPDRAIMMKELLVNTSKKKLLLFYPYETTISNIDKFHVYSISRFIMLFLTNFHFINYTQQIQMWFLVVELLGMPATEE